MNTSGDTARSRLRRRFAWVVIIVALAAALACVAVAAMAEHADIPAAPDAAYAAIYIADDEQADGEVAAGAQTDDQQNRSTAVGESDEAERIDDEENPMSSGLGGGEPVAANGGMGMGITIAVIVGIIAVVAFFGFKTGRLNSSIRKMNDTFK